MGELPGKKILLKGNHDRFPNDFYLECGWLPMDIIVLKLQGVRIVFSHQPIPNHPYDINIHGHLHNLSVPYGDKIYLPMALEHMRYSPIALTDKFIRKLRSYVDKQKQPSPQEIHALIKSDRPLSTEDLGEIRISNDNATTMKSRKRYNYEVV